jgi:hypothetical protein
MTVFAGASLAQRPGPEFRRPVACEPLEPRTKLEAIDAGYEKVLIKGFSQIATLNLLKALESVSKVNESVTKLASFEARYRTVGD